MNDWDGKDCVGWSCAFHDDVGSGKLHRPLFLGCSGGAGHNSAIKAIIHYLADRKLIDVTQLVSYSPIFPEEKTEQTFSKKEFQFGMTVMHKIPLLSRLIRWTMKKLSLPILPAPALLQSEIQKLIMAQEKNGRKMPRLFVDMLLDVYSTGYETVAVWNLFQRADAIKDLRKCAALQAWIDKHHHRQVKDYFFNLLIQASIKQQPYTEIISAQAMGLAAVCEAVIDYNKIIANTAFAPIKIHQYLSDLPTAGATHFFKVLLNLNSETAQQIYLYGIHLADSEMYSKLKTRQFAKLISINSQENPLVRPGFQDRDLFRIDPAQFIMLKLQANHEEIDYPVEANARVASIMLGSQTATDTTQYVKILAHHQSPYDIVFVFGAKKPHIAREISELAAKSSKKIIPLDEQSDKHMAPIFTRSQLLIIRGGGLTIMEQLALPSCEDKIMLIHCKNEAWRLTSGISWEDANVDLFIQEMQKIKVMVKRTSIQHFEQDLLEIKNDLSNKNKPAIFKDVELSLTTY